MWFYLLIFMYWYIFLEFFIFVSLKRIRIEEIRRFTLTKYIGILYNLSWEETWIKRETKFHNIIGFRIVNTKDNGFIITELDHKDFILDDGFQSYHNIQRYVRCWDQSHHYCLNRCHFDVFSIISRITLHNNLKNQK